MPLALADASHAVHLLIHTATSAQGNPALWYVTRAAAVCAYVLLTLTVALGILRTLARDLGVRASWVLDELHQFIALLASAFVALHLVALLFDPVVPFGLLNLLLPLAEPYKPLAVDLGVLGFYALLVVLASSWLRRRMSYALWRGLHYVSFAVFFLVTLHGLLAGSDASEPWMRGLYIGSASAVVFLVVMRLLAPSREAPAPTRHAS